MTTTAGLYRSVVDEAVEIAGADAASVQVLERGGLRLVGWRGFHSTSAAYWELVVPESASSCGMALVSGKRVVVPDLEAEAALAGSQDLEEYRRSGLRAVQSTPLVADDGGVVGMFSTHWGTSREPSAAELDRIDEFASTVAALVAHDRDVLEGWAPVQGDPLHEVNLHIRKLAAGFSSVGGDDLPQEYLCECGCGGWVALTLKEFDASVGASSPVVVPGHVLTRAQAARRFSRLLRSDASALRAEALQRRRKTHELRKRQPKPPPE